MTPTTTPTPENYRLIWLNPLTLAEHPKNVRYDLGDVSDMAASLREGAIGLIEPLVVVPLAEGGHRIVAGHRRNLAAVTAEVAEVPCIERTDWMDRDEEQLAAMIAENVHREALTAAEEADAYVQLAAFPEWTAEEIARRTGRPVERVRTALAAAQLPEDVRSKVHGGAVTLEQAAAMEVFIDDEKAMARLMKAVDTGYLHYALIDERRKVEKLQRVAELRAELEALPVRTIKKPKNFPWGIELPLDRLRTATGRAITKKNHAKCPGHAAFVNTDEQAIVYVCVHPKEWGHEITGSYSHLSEQEQADNVARLEAERERREQWDVAQEARRAWLRELITGEKPSPKLLRQVVETMLVCVPHEPDPDVLLDLLTKRASADAAVVVLGRVVKRTPDNRMPMLALAYLAASAEANLDDGFAGRQWRFDLDLADRYFGLLEVLGYPLSEVEASQRQEIITETIRRAQAEQELDEALADVVELRSPDASPAAEADPDEDEEVPAN